MGFKHFYESYDDESGGVDWESLYMTHYSGVNNAARDMGIDIESCRLINTRRGQLSADNLLDVSQGKHQWYSIGLAWMEWIQVNEGTQNLIAPYTFAIEFNKPPMNIKSKKLVSAFQSKYILDIEIAKDRAINWKKLYEDGVGALEFNPYNRNFEVSPQSWYSSIDMSSGAIVNKSIIKNIVLMYDGSDDFRDMGIKI